MRGQRGGSSRRINVQPGVHVLRAELTLARQDRWSLKEVPLKPDPLTKFVRAYAALNPALGETAEVCFDFVPLDQSQVRSRQRQIERSDKGSGRPGAGGLGGAWEAANGRHMQGGRSRSGQPVYHRKDPLAVGTVGARTLTRDVATTLYRWDPLFEIQVLLWVTSVDKGRAREHLSALEDAFGVWTEANSFRRVGMHVGSIFLGGGANAPWRKAWFDWRVTNCRFAPAKKAVVSAREMAALLRPPTSECKAANVLRSGGLVPAPPRALPDYSGQADLLPWGWVHEDTGERAVGIPLRDTLFTLTCGKAGFGKTERAIAEFIALALGGHGCFYYDPHADALERIRPHLVGIKDRVIELNLSPRGRSALQAGWNLFSMEGRTEEDIEAIVSSVVVSFSTTLGWGEINNRAITLTTMAAQALCELALLMPPEMAPTLFQMTTLLSNEAWRMAVVPFLSQASQEFWDDIFPSFPGEAITPITNLISRLRSSASVAALFGSSQSSYNIRQAMDQGKVVLACPAGGASDKNRLIANFLVFDVLQALLSRRDLDVGDRRPFHVFIDELQTVDGPAGNLAAILEETRKFGGRFHGMVQQPSRLTDKTLEALLNNLSCLAATNLSAKQAKLVAAEWSGKVDPGTLTQLPAWHFISSVTLDGQPTTPFKVRGFSLAELGELLGHVPRPDLLPDLDAAIDRNLGRRRVGTVLAELDTKSAEILRYLRSQHPGPVGPEPGAGPDGADPQPGRPRLHAVPTRVGR